MWLHKQICESALEAGHGRNRTFDFLYTTEMYYDIDTATEAQREDMERTLKQKKQNAGARERIAPT